jgi:hypothetical protein
VVLDCLRFIENHPVKGDPVQQAALFLVLILPPVEFLRSGLAFNRRIVFRIRATYFIVSGHHDIVLKQDAFFAV